jgi:hypothetical protein
VIEKDTEIPPCPARVVIVHGFQPTKLKYGINIAIIVGGGRVIIIRKCNQRDKSKRE